jgi:membrane associated rhomboid family serine protease
MLGIGRFIGLYAGSAIAGAASSAVYYRIKYGEATKQRTMGASAAISGLLTVFGLTNRTAQVMLMGIIPVPALYAYVSIVVVIPDTTLF